MTPCSPASTEPRPAYPAALLPGVPLIESPLYVASREMLGFDAETLAIADALHTWGYAVIDFPDPEFAARAPRIMASLAPRLGLDPADPRAVGGCEGRIQDAWRFDADVRAIAANASLLALLEKLYGRRAIPFQTLNFPVGTEQALHSDSVHFSSQPERFMCGVWVALEDIDAGSGPLSYCPGSHRWPVLSNAHLGRKGWGSSLASAQAPFEAPWKAMIAANGEPIEQFFPRRGQALIWTANLLHGGAPRLDPARSRWSQVTHYYFADCLYYTPAFSDEPLGRLDLRRIINIATGAVEPNSLLGEAAPFVVAAKRAPPRWWKRLTRGLRRKA